MSFVQLGSMRAEGCYVGSGLGALSRGGLTIDYYPASTLKFSDQNLRKLHDAIVDFDFKWRGAMSKIAGVAGALGGLIGLDPEMIKQAGTLPCPLAGTALILEVSVGGRPLDAFVVGMLRLLGNTLIAQAAILGTVATIFGLLAGAGAATATATTGGLAVAILGPAAASLVPAATGLVAAAGAAGIIGAICLGLSEGKLPNRSTFGNGLKASAIAAGKAPPTEAEIDRAYNALNVAIEGGNTVLAASSITANKDWIAKVVSTAAALKKQPTLKFLSAAAIEAMAIKAVEKKFGKQPKIIAKKTVVAPPPGSFAPIVVKKQSLTAPKAAAASSNTGMYVVGGLTAAGLLIALFKPKRRGR